MLEQDYHEDGNRTLPETLLPINKFTGCRTLKKKYKKNICFVQRKVPDREIDMPV